MVSKNSVIEKVHRFNNEERELMSYYRCTMEDDNLEELLMDLTEDERKEQFDRFGKVRTAIRNLRSELGMRVITAYVRHEAAPSIWADGFILIDREQYKDRELCDKAFWLVEKSLQPKAPFSCSHVAVVRTSVYDKYAIASDGFYYRYVEPKN